MEALETVRESGPETGSRTGTVTGDPGASLSLCDVELWRGDYCVCNGLSVTAHSGQLLHLRGGNGAGKTSLIRVLAGLVLPESGEVVYGERRHKPRSPMYREHLRYVAHRDGIKQELEASENLRLSARLLADRTDPGHVQDALDRVGIGHLSMRRVGEMSAGQRRRLALARLLLGRGHLWLLDEPLVSLDVDGIALVEDLVREHLQSGGLAVIATHQPFAAEGLDVTVVDLPYGRPDVS